MNGGNDGAVRRRLNDVQHDNRSPSRDRHDTRTREKEKGGSVGEKDNHQIYDWEGDDERNSRFSCPASYCFVPT